MRERTRMGIIYNERGNALSYAAAFLFLIIFGAAIFLYFLYQEKLFRFEFGPEKIETQELVFDKNKVLELFRREELVKEQAKELTREGDLLKHLQKQIEIEKTKLGEDKASITASMKTIEEKFKQLSEEEEKNLKRLSTIYSKMKAQRVAGILNVMDVETVAALLVRMQDKDAAKILGEIGVREPDRAAVISNIIKGKFKRDLFEKIP